MKFLNLKELLDEAPASFFNFVIFTLPLIITHAFSGQIIA